MVILSTLLNIVFPSNATIFFQGAFVFANMDVLSGEQFFEDTMIFKETGPLNDKFDLFDISNKNFYMNSGSYLIM